VAAGGPVELGGTGAGDWTVRAGDASLAYPLRVAGGFGAEILVPPIRTDVVTLADGDVIEAEVGLLPRDPSAPLSGVGMFGLIARPAPRDAAEAVAAAAAAAADADVAVVVVGLTEEQETEAVDKATLRLPGGQDALVSAVAAAARRTVVVVNAATPVLMPWLDEVDAVLWAGLPGQEGGHAVAAALLGDIEPAGRLVTTFPAADGASPAWSVTPVDGKLTYEEGTFIGYRGHAAGRAPAPAFWLGHGLGYTTWEYAAAHRSGERDVTVTVTNTGTRSGREVVQVYLRPAEADQPVRLAGWQAVDVTPGASATVTVRTDGRMWRRWDTDANRWDTLAAGGDLLVARGLGDVRATVPLS
jgi:beta-glucosidase